MKPPNLTNTAWIVLGLAIVAWCGAGFFAWTLMGSDAAYKASVGDTQNLSSKDSENQKVHTSAQDVALESGELVSALQVDPVAFVKTIQSIGGATGTTITISDALPESIAARTQPAGMPSLHAFGFTIEATGSFSSLIRVAKMLETLPAPSSIEGIELQHVPSSGSSSSWHMSARVRVLTTANIFS